MINVEVAPLELGVREVREVLGERVARFLSDEVTVASINREDFTSRVYDVEDGPIRHYVDGHLFEVDFPEGEITYILHHKTSGGNPWADITAGGLFPGGTGLDMRVWQTYVYEWDGKTTIKATEPNGRVTEIKGEDGVPDAMLPTLRQSLGHAVGTKRFVNPA